MSGTDNLTPILLGILTAAQAQLTIPVSSARLEPGNFVAWDKCNSNECGQLYVRVISLIGSIGQNNPSRHPCAPTYGCRIGVGTVRCAHVVQDDGTFPTDAELIVDVTEMGQDRADILQALSCDVAPLLPESSRIGYKVEQWLPAGPQGGCHTGEWTIFFNLNICFNC